MKAVVWEAYGPPEVLQVQTRPIPIPGRGQVLVKVHAATVAASEAMGRRGQSLIGRLFTGVRRPRRALLNPGMEFAGEIVALGSDVTQFAIGDAVLGFTGFRMGTYSDYVCVPADRDLALKPATLSFVEASACVDGATTALFFLRDKGQLQAGQRVLVIGASGCIGSFAVQIARHLGAHVSGVCSTRNLALVASLGADVVIDYTTTDFTQNGQHYDLIFDTIGVSSFSACRASLTASGRYLVTTGNLLPLLLGTMWTGLFRQQKLIFAASVEKTAKLATVREWVEGDIIKPIIDRTFPLEQVADAHRFVDTGHKQGNVVLTMHHDSVEGVNMMKAVVYEKYGPPEVLEMRDIPKPEPADNEILIKVYATTVTAGDWRIRAAKPFMARLFNGLRRPTKIKILGFEIAGVIESVGKDVTRFKPGEAVFAPCGFEFGGYAEYRVLPEDDLIARKPANVSFEEAAAVPVGAGTALRYLRVGKVGPGHKVMVYGASGSVGTYAVQLAKHFGAEVTGVCSTRNLELVKSIGADHVLDYTRDDYTAEVGQYDVVFDTVGKGKLGGLLGLLKDEGHYLGASDIAFFRMFRGIMTRTFTKKQFTSETGGERAEDLDYLTELLGAGTIKPVIDRIFPFDQIQDAHRHAERLRKRGNVAITVFSEDNATER